MGEVLIGLVAGGAISLGWPHRLAAQAPNLLDPPFMRAALTVMSFDHLAADCAGRGGWSADDGRQIETWRTANGVDRIRNRIAELEQGADRSRVEQARATVRAALAKQRIDPCAAALVVIRLPDAQFATLVPEMLASLSGAGTAPPAADQPAAPVLAAPVTTNALLEQIESFGFHSRMSMGVGGFLTTKVYPIVLFRDGEALRDIEGLQFPGGVEAHRRANPKEWTRWRRTGTKVESLVDGAWKPLHFQKTFSTLPANFTLDGYFQSLSGSGTIAIGGTESVAAWRDYLFSPDGLVVRGGGAGGSGEFGDVRTAASSVAPNRRGRYRIEGLTLSIDYDDGSRESRLLVTDPNDPKSAIWLDGQGYARRTPRKR